MYSRRFKDGGLPKDIDRSVELMEMAVNIVLDEPFSNKDSFRRALADALLEIYKIAKSSENRDSVINIYRSQMRKYPNHKNCDRWLRNLSVLLNIRYKQSNNLKDLKNEIAFTKKNVERLNENSFDTDQIQ